VSALQNVVQQTLPMSRFSGTRKPRAFASAGRNEIEAKADWELSLTPHSRIRKQRHHLLCSRPKSPPSKPPYFSTGKQSGNPGVLGPGDSPMSTPHEIGRRDPRHEGQPT